MRSLIREDPKGKEILKSWLYQSLKALLSIKGQVKKEKLFNSVNLDWDGRKRDKTNKRSIIEMLSIKTIKLRIGWLFSKYREKKWLCEHRTDSEEIMNKWAKTSEWGTKWSDRFRAHNLQMTFALLKLTIVKYQDGRNEAQLIAELINNATEELVQVYFRK